MPRIAHISDTHIPTIKRHDEYRQVFDQIYNKLREEKVDYIVHTGDLFHTKLQLTPESVTLAVEFLKNLGSIAPVYLIAGNHDTNLRNNKRLDSISPIVEAISDLRIVYLRNSGPIYLNDIVFNVLSIFDRDNWVSFKDTTPSPLPVIALFHGSIKGVLTDTGYVIEHGDSDVSIFEGHDYALLGDIHLTNQKVDDEGRIRYAGSTVQQNFGETDDKGFLIWDIKDKNNFEVQAVTIKCPKPFTTLHLWNDGSIQENTVPPKGARIRLVSEFNLSVDKVKNAIDVAKTRFKPESVTFVSKATSSREELKDVSNLSRTLNLRDLGVQEGLIKDFLAPYNPDEELLQRVYEMNEKYNLQVEQGEEVGRNISWKLKSLEWDNLFNYGKGNRIDFTKLNGVVGLLGPNGKGKTSVLDSLLYTTFNTTSKNNRKNLNIINQNLDSCRSKVVFEIDNNEYTIERKSEKYTKKSKGVEITEAKTDVEFSGMEESTLTGLDRSDTDKVIRRYLGTVDDFLMTSMASQLDSLSFINEGSTNRKTILAKFLDLDIFEAKFKLAKGDAAEIKAVLKKLEGTEFDSEIQKTGDVIRDSEKGIKEQKELSEIAQTALNLLREQLFAVQADIKNFKKVESSTEAYLSMVNHQQTADSLSRKTLEIDKKLYEISGQREVLKGDLLENINDILEDNLSLREKNDNLGKLAAEHKLLSQAFGTLQKSAGLLSEVPCGDQFPSCRFIKDAFQARDSLQEKQESLTQLNTRASDLQKEINSTPDYDALIRKHNAAESMLNKLALLEKDLQIEREKLLAKQNTAQEMVEVCREKYEERRKLESEAISIEEKLQSEKNLKNEIHAAELNINSIQQKITNFYKDNGYQISRLETLEEQKQELADKRKEFAAYDLYLKAMHPNGISYEVIKQKLPVINNEINKILANVVDFQVFLVNEDDKLDLMIKHPKYDPRPLEMGSGSEKSLASIAIRLAFLNVTSLPKSNIFFLDEPGTSLDADNLGGFIRILDLIKGYFDVVLLISHLDILKDAVDGQINIDNRDGFAHVAA